MAGGDVGAMEGVVGKEELGWEVGFSDMAEDGEVSGETGSEEGGGKVLTAVEGVDSEGEEVAGCGGQVVGEVSDGGRDVEDGEGRVGVGGDEGGEIAGGPVVWSVGETLQQEEGGDIRWSWVAEMDKRRHRGLLKKRL